MDEITDPLLAELNTYIQEYQEYEIEVLSISDDTHLIRIPAVYEKIESLKNA